MDFWDEECLAKKVPAVPGVSVSFVVLCKNVASAKIEIEVGE